MSGPPRSTLTGPKPTSLSFKHAPRNITIQEDDDKKRSESVAVPLLDSTMTRLPTTPNSKARMFAMGGFAANKLLFDEQGNLSDDGASYDLDELSLENKEISDEDVLNILASKHRFKDKGKVYHIAIIDYL